MLLSAIAWPQCQLSGSELLFLLSQYPQDPQGEICWERISGSAGPVQPSAIPVGSLHVAQDYAAITDLAYLVPASREHRAESVISESQGEDWIASLYESLEIRAIFEGDDFYLPAGLSAVQLPEPASYTSTVQQTATAIQGLAMVEVARSLACNRCEGVLIEPQLEKVAISHHSVGEKLALREPLAAEIAAAIFSARSGVLYQPRRPSGTLSIYKERGFEYGLVDFVRAAATGIMAGERLFNHARFRRHTPEPRVSAGPEPS